MSASASSVQAVELKGRMLLVSVLRVFHADPAILGPVLVARREQAPDLMRDMPIVLDLDPVAEAGDLGGVIEQVRGEGFKVIGLQAGAAAERLQGVPGIDWPVLQLGGRGAGGAPSGEVPLEDDAAPAEAEKEADKSKEAPAAAVAAVHTSTRIIDRPVRSGQQIYARGGDLLVTGAVSPGAELLADGHIHVLGPLRGRALAGVRGLVNARIFCRRLDAELLSIAGHYRIAEDITEAERGENRLVTLDNESLKIAEV